MNRSSEIESLGWEYSIESASDVDTYYLTTGEEETYRLTVSDKQVRIVHKYSVSSSKLVYICDCTEFDLEEIMRQIPILAENIIV